MANVTITIPDALIPRLRDAMHWKFPETVGAGDAAAFKAKTAAYWKAILVEYEAWAAEVAVNQAQRTAVQDAAAQAEADGAAIG